MPALWKIFIKNTGIAIGLFAALFVLLGAAEYIWPTLTLLQWHNAAWCVGIPASIIGVAYILTIRDPQNYTGFYAGIVMSFLLGIQFFLQQQYDSCLLYFCVFIPFQIKSIVEWKKPQPQTTQTFAPQFLSTKAMISTLCLTIAIIIADYLLATFLFQHNTLLDNIATKTLNGLLIASSIMANYWLIYRKNDAWIYWVLYSIAGIGLFIALNNIFSIVLFCFFLFINGGADGVHRVSQTHVAYLRSCGALIAAAAQLFQDDLDIGLADGAGGDHHPVLCIGIEDEGGLEAGDV